MNLFGPDDAPALFTADDAQGPVQVGLKFTISGAGIVTGIRFYKDAGNVGTHIGYLWTDDGTLLGSVTFTDETDSGWQSANFADPISVTTGTLYVVTYGANNDGGGYSSTGHYFENDISNGSITAPASGSVGGNGVYAYAPDGTFPTNSFNATNYWVDLIYEPSATGTAPGDMITVTGSVIPGTASGRGNANGSTIAVAASVVPGSATGAAVARGTIIPLTAVVLPGHAIGNPVINAPPGDRMTTVPFEQRGVSVAVENRSAAVSVEDRTVIVAAENRVAVTVQGELKMLPLPPKDPSEVLNYPIDWTARLNGDTIVSSSWTVPADLVKTDDSKTNSTTTVWLSGGIVPNKYKITNEIVTAAGCTMVQSVSLKVALK